MNVEGLLLKETREGCTLSLKVIPKSSQNKVVGLENGLLKMRVQAPPTDGEANEAVIRLLVDVLHVPKNSLSILKGQQSRQKMVFIRGLSVAQVLKILAEQ